MKLRRISSLLTVFYKFGLPAIFAFGMVNVLIWGVPGVDFGRNELTFIYVSPFLFGAWSLWQSWGTKWVAIDETNRRLYVSNYRREISIPLSHIVNVTESIWSDPRRIKIYLSEPSEFGDKIVFFATYRYGGLFAAPHPILDELTDLAVKATMAE